VVECFFSNAQPMIADRFISVVAEGIEIHKGDIEGDSFGLALMAALLGLPAGPAMTGSVDELGRVTRIADINEKLGAIGDTAFGPLIFPISSYEEAEFKRKNSPLKRAILAANTGNYPVNMELGMYPIDTVSQMVAFFQGNAFKAWLARIDPNGTFTESADESFRNINAAITLVNVVRKMNLIRTRLESLPDEGLEEAEAEKITSKLQAEFKALGMQYDDLVGETQGKRSEKAVQKKVEKAGRQDLSKMIAKTKLQMKDLNAAVTTSTNKYYINKTTQKAFKKTKSLDKYPADFPIESMRNKPTSASDKTRAWLWKYAEGEFKSFSDEKGKLLAWFFLPAIKTVQRAEKQKLSLFRKPEMGREEKRV